MIPASYYKRSLSQFSCDIAGAFDFVFMANALAQIRGPDLHPLLKNHHHDREEGNRQNAISLYSEIAKVSGDCLVGVENSLTGSGKRPEMDGLILAG